MDRVKTRGKRMALLAAVLAIATILGCIAAIFTCRPDLAGKWLVALEGWLSGSQSEFRPERGKVGATISLERGAVRVSKLLQAVSDTTGLPLIVRPAREGMPIEKRTIRIVSRISAADEAFIKAICEMNLLRIYRETLPNDNHILVVEDIESVPAY